MPAGWRSFGEMQQRTRLDLYPIGLDPQTAPDMRRELPGARFRRRPIWYLLEILQAAAQVVELEMVVRCHASAYLP